MRIGFIGLGFMGSRIASLLVDARHELTVCDANGDAVAALTAKGASGAHDPSQAARGQELVVMCLPGPKEIKEVVLDRRTGVLAGISASAVLVDHSTNSRALALDVTAASRAAGVHFLDAPVTGRPPTLTIFAGGDPEPLERIRGVFELFSSRIISTGENGSGAATKLVSQLVMYSNFLTLCEGFVLGANAGLHVEDMVDNINGGMVLDFTKQKLMDRSFDVNDGAPMALIAKDMRLIHEMARDLGIKSNIVKRLHTVYRSGVDRGWGTDHFARVIELFEEQGAVNVRGEALSPPAVTPS